MELCICQIWPPGSLEEEVQNLVKTWEMELFHKANLDDFKTLDPNKKERHNPVRNRQTWRGYNPDKEASESSHKAFTTTFPRGFALEIFQVYSGPPEIVYKFRHWGLHGGAFPGPCSGWRIG
ncbi:unnamed protein product [Prunus armeniaca]|uniref:Pathogen-related protein n=1 Tax=Prunus armeniaca TaxID=36596 RepID=A0A6J5Y0G7_PRUAR|nr:unnamed protein product [Prunus armeniaca]